MIDPPRCASCRTARTPTAPSAADKRGTHGAGAADLSARRGQGNIDRYHALRERIDARLEPKGFGVLADFYTEDAVYVDGAWGRIEGRPAIARWLVDSMAGMEDWKFPVEFIAIEGIDVVVKWTQIMPRTRPDGTPYRQSAYSRLIYAGDGKFSYEEDVYNMAQVLEDVAASGWRPGGPMNFPPAQPDRNFDHS
jgi:ketosteroid isomerase-like protein